MANSQIKKVEGIPSLYIDERAGNYLIRIYHAGATRSKSLGTKSLTVAKQKIASAIRDIVTTDKKKLRNKLVKDYEKSFRESFVAEELSENSVRVYDIALRHHILPFWGNLIDADINQAKYAEYLAWHKRARGTKLFNAHKTLGKFISHMKSEGAKVEPLDLFLPKKEKDAQKEEIGTYITRDEFDKILAVKLLEPRDTIQFKLGYVLGMRIGEIANLRKDAVVVKGNAGEIRLKAKETKTRTARTIPLTKEITELLEEWIVKTDSVYVFPAHRNYKNPTSKQVIERQWRAAKKAAHIRRRMRFHDLRHTAATNMAEVGIDPVKACVILGMSLKLYEKTYVKKHKLNLSMVADVLESFGARP